MKIAITGASGLVGGACMDLLRQRGHEVIVLGRQPVGDGGYVPFELGKVSVAPERLRGIDALIHCAHDMSVRDWAEVERVNVNGTIELLKAAHAAGIQKIIFISSVSAFDGCESFYGKGKLAVEKWAQKETGIVCIRPGLVHGDPAKGIFAALAKIAGKLPILPVFDGGHQKMVLIHKDDLAQVVERILERPPNSFPEPFLVSYPKAVEFRAVLAALARKAGKSPRFMSVPSGVAIFGLASLEMLKVPLRFRKDNLLGLICPTPKFDFSTVNGLGVALRDFFE